MRGYIVPIVFLFCISMAFAVTGPYDYGGKSYYVVSADNPAEDTGNEVCAAVGKTCVGYTAYTTDVCKNFHPSATVTSSYSGDKSGVYCDGAPQTGECAQRQNSCHLCPNCIVGVDCGTPIGNLYDEMYVECADSAQCSTTMHARDVQSLLREVPLLNARLQQCPVTLPNSIAKLIGGDTRVDIKMNDGTTESLLLSISNKQVTGISRGPGTTCRHTLTISEDNANTVLASPDRAMTISYLFRTKRLTLGGCTFVRKFISFFAQPIGRLIVARQLPQPPPTQTVETQQGSRVCDFYQTTKKIVTCSAYKAADTFCVITMGTTSAKAVKCEENGQVLCTIPCKLPPGQIQPTMCPFDISRTRGVQAPPLDFCPDGVGNQQPAQTPQDARGKPANCDDTYLPGHSGYAQNKALWDSYSADTDAVCQSQYGRGTPYPCVHTVQLSVSGNPYYLCWYRR